MQNGPLVAVIGGGIAGQSAAAALSEAGALVTVFDKARGAGGRLATRREGGLQWDHGAQYFTARDPALKARLAPLTAQGVVVPWAGIVGTLTPAGFVAEDGTEPRFVGCPRMSALVGALGSGATVYSVEIREIAPRGPLFTLTDRHGEHFGPYDAVIIATPAPQAVSLLALEPALAARVAEVEMAPCWALMLGVSGSLGLTFDGAFVAPDVAGGALSWIARDNSKPGRADGAVETWIAHASPDWSRTHLEDMPEDVAAALLAAFTQAVGTSTRPDIVQAHRWRHAMTLRPLGQRFLLDPRRPIGACGDWCLGARIEGAFLSGHDLGLATAARLGLVPRQASSSASQ